MLTILDNFGLPKKYFTYKYVYYRNQVVLLSICVKFKTIKYCHLKP